jgi:hypothetical protein
VWVGDMGCVHVGGFCIAWLTRSHSAAPPPNLGPPLLFTNNSSTTTTNNKKAPSRTACCWTPWWLRTATPTSALPWSAGSPSASKVRLSNISMCVYVHACMQHACMHACMCVDVDADADRAALLARSLATLACPFDHPLPPLKINSQHGRGPVPPQPDDGAAHGAVVRVEPHDEEHGRPLRRREAAPAAAAAGAGAGAGAGAAAGNGRGGCRRGELRRARVVGCLLVGGRSRPRACLGSGPAVFACFDRLEIGALVSLGSMSYQHCFTSYVCVCVCVCVP